MGKVIVVAFALLLASVIGGLVIFTKSHSDQLSISSPPIPEKSPKFDIEDFRFEKTENWGPCPPGEICTQKTILKGDGYFEREGQDNDIKFLSVIDLLPIVKKIESTGIMGKECTAQPTLDYSATYNIRTGDKQKEIIYPGCKEELEEIEKLFL